MSPQRSTGERAFVLGLDGLPWNLIERWSDDGSLPTFATLREEGAGGQLQSTTPPATSLAWPSIATGVWPDKHGIYAFQALDPKYTHEMNTSRNVRQPELWKIVSPAVVGNVPMTYPAEGIDGKQVAGMMTPERDDGFTHPESLANEIAERIPEYEIALQWERYHGREDAFFSALSDLLETRSQLMRLLMETEEWRLFFFVYTAPDRLQHLVWDEEVLVDHYRLLDEILDEVMDYVEEREATLYVVSDHGFGPVDRLMYLNRILEAEGYLAQRDDTGTRGVLGRVGLTKDRVKGMLNQVGIDEQTLLKLFPRSVLDAAASRVPGDHQLYDVDYEKTVAFVHGPGNLYINDTERFTDGLVEPHEVPDLKAEVMETLQSVVDEETGINPITVWDGDTHYPTDDFAPDLIVRGREGYAKRTSLNDELFVDSDTMAGHHEREGIFLAWGPDVEAGSTPVEATVVDVAPTVLHGLGEPIPSQTDGRVLEEIFAPESLTATRPVSTTTYGRTGSDEHEDRDFDAVEDRLRGLGYME